MGFPEGAWHEMCGEGTVQAAEAMAPSTARYEIEMTEDADGHRKNRDLGNTLPSWKRSGMWKR